MGGILPAGCLSRTPWWAMTPWSTGLSRRRVLLAAAGAAAGGLFLRQTAWAVETEVPLRFGIPQILISPMLDEFGCIDRYLRLPWRRPVSLTQHKTNAELAADLLSGELDLAWLSPYAYVRRREQLQAIAAPLTKGAATAQSLLIVAADRPASMLSDLAGDTHAFVDPESASGFLVTVAELAKIGTRPGSFFNRTFFTNADRNVVRAVAAGLAGSGTCDGHVFEVLKEIEPRLTGAVRVLSTSSPIAPPPIVAKRGGLSAAAMAAAKSLFVGMRTTATGEAALGKLRLDGFAEADDALYAPITAMAERLKGIV